MEKGRWGAEVGWRRGGGGRWEAEVGWRRGGGGLK